MAEKYNLKINNYGTGTSTENVITEKPEGFYIHAVYDDTDPAAPINYHTHGLEDYGLKNICMIQEGDEYSKFCFNFLCHIGNKMIEGEDYITHEHHCIVDDDLDEKVIHVFSTKETRDAYDSEDVIQIDYLFDELFFDEKHQHILKFELKDEPNYGEWVIMM